MSLNYKAVGWNRQKMRYDRLLAAGVGLYLAAFCGTTLATHPDVTAETVLIRGLGTCALLLLHVILCIGPLARLDARFLPLLYNRRHLGVTMFLLALLHAAFATFQFHALGNLNPFVSVLASNTRFGSVSQFPFELFGVLALVILFLMAATSHDFWLANLSAPVWKALHMGVYFAYASLILHVVLGVLQAETSPIYAALILAGLALVVGLHVAAARRDRALDEEKSHGDFVDVCSVAEIPESRAKIACLGGERVAVFKYDGKISAISNVCQHQNGPLGEGCIVGGLVTCPWHGYQYRPEDGASPPPFHEKVPTFHVRIAGGRVLVDPRPNPPGTRVEPAAIHGGATFLSPETGKHDAAAGMPPLLEPFFIGYQKIMPGLIAAFLRPRLAALLVMAPALGVSLAIPQNPFGPGTFAFGHPHAFEGVVLAGSSPTLLLAAPDGAASRCFLCAPGKQGAAGLFPGPQPARRVTLRGTLIEREGRRMIEVIPGSVRFAGDAPAPAGPRHLGAFTLRGEIVDSKCYLGVMKPGNLKPHKSCAIRCISGGVPPVFLVRDREGNALYLLLEGSDGRAVNREVLPFVAEPLEIPGLIEQRDDMLVLKAEPARFRRLR